MVYPLFQEGLILSPRHRDLPKIADAAGSFLTGKIARSPWDYGVKRFMRSSDAFGWEVKRKLVWLGTRSYMFRLLHQAYLDENNDGEYDIPHTDDFVCQETTRWSGLGPIDILAGVLDVPDAQKQELRGWYFRHAAAYRVLATGRDWIDALNVISDQPYRIRFSMDRNPFKKDMLVFGSVTPWRGEWYWSGMQQALGDATQESIDQIKLEMKKKTSIVCRYWKEQEQLVRDRFAADVKRMLDYYGKDLIVYPDGLAMAADWEREMKAAWASQSPEDAKSVMERHGLKHPKPNMVLPEDLVGRRNGLGVFINPDEGKEILFDFDAVVSGLRKNGEDMTEEELDALHGCIVSDAVSPAFVKRLLREYGGEASFKAAFKLEICGQGYWLEYLLRSWKGGFYRKRFPQLAVV
jgi:hypothetical protein